MCSLPIERKDKFYYYKIITFDTHIIKNKTAEKQLIHKKNLVI